MVKHQFMTSDAGQTWFIKDQPGYYLFTTQRHFINFGFGSKDLSDMGAYIQRKKQELEI